MTDLLAGASSSAQCSVSIHHMQNLSCYGLAELTTVDLRHLLAVWYFLAAPVHAFCHLMHFAWNGLKKWLERCIFSHGRGTQDEQFYYRPQSIRLSDLSRLNRLRCLCVCNSWRMRIIARMRSTGFYLNSEGILKWSFFGQLRSFQAFLCNPPTHLNPFSERMIKTVRFFRYFGQSLRLWLLKLLFLMAGLVGFFFSTKKDMFINQSIFAND